MVIKVEGGAPEPEDPRDPTRIFKLAQDYWTSCKQVARIHRDSLKGMHMDDQVKELDRLLKQRDEQGKELDRQDGVSKRRGLAATIKRNATRYG